MANNDTLTKSESQQVASTQRCYRITQADLPLSCPLPSMRLWDAHPRVFLPIKVGGRVFCPYCDAEYILEENAASTHS